MKTNKDASYLTCFSKEDLRRFPNGADLFSEALWNYTAFTNVHFRIDYLQFTTYIERETFMTKFVLNF